MNYIVTFKQYHTYEVKASNSDEALDKAHEEFLKDMRTSVADTFYDDVDIQEMIQ